jgi:hypothetical protein
MGESCKSLYKPSNPKKYKGNPNNIVCRSSWERHFCRWCDLNENVLSWASEEFSIPYIKPTDGKVHRYYPDFICEVKEQDGKIKKYIIEVKPKKQTQPPKKPSRVTKSYIYESTQYAVNQAKWKYAEEFAKDNGVEFKIITEEDLGIKPYGKSKQNRRRR